jgi:hypothetical protein
MRQHYDLYRQHDHSSTAAAARRGDYFPGPAIPNPERRRFLEWLLRFAAEERQDEVAGLVRDELASNYAALSEPA